MRLCMSMNSPSLMVRPVVRLDCPSGRSAISSGVSVSLICYSLDSIRVVQVTDLLRGVSELRQQRIGVLAQPGGPLPGGRRGGRHDRRETYRGDRPEVRMLRPFDDLARHRIRVAGGGAEVVNQGARHADGLQLLEPDGRGLAQETGAQLLAYLPAMLTPARRGRETFGQAPFGQPEDGAEAAPEMVLGGGDADKAPVAGLEEPDAGPGHQ